MRWRNFLHSPRKKFLSFITVSYTHLQKAIKAVRSGRFKDEIVPVQVPQRKGEVKIFDTDEYPKEGVTVESISGLRPAFKEGGMVTAANSSGLNDSGAAVVVMSEEKANELGITPLCSIKSVSYTHLTT